MSNTFTNEEFEIVFNKIYKKLMRDKTKQDKLKNDINNIIICCTQKSTNNCKK